MADTKISAITAATDLSNMVLAGEALGVNKSYTTALFDTAYVNTSGDTMTGKLTTLASATGGAGFNLPAGAAPTTPTNGDLWTTSTALFYQINGTTFQSATLAGTETLTNKTINGSSNTITNVSLTSGITGTLGVTHGGTGLASLTAGDILYASAANTLSALAKGTANQTLQMNAGATAPTWVTVAAASGILVGTQVFTSSGTYTPTASATKAIAIVTGGGAGGSGCSTSAGSTGGGGGAGGTTIAYITSLGTLTATIGAAGTGGAAGTNSGGAGGATSLGTITANGGSGSGGTSSAAGIGGAATATGTLGTAGGDGSKGAAFGNGGSSFWGGGGSANSGTAAGISANAFGAGGGGASNSGTTPAAGGSGAAGVIIVFEFK